MFYNKKHNGYIFKWNAKFPLYVIKHKATKLITFRGVAKHRSADCLLVDGFSKNISETLTEISIIKCT